MPNKPIDMYKIRQILRLYADGRGSKFISSTTGIARNTVKKYLAQFTSLGLSLQDIERMSDGQLASIFLPEKPVEVIPQVDQLAKMLPELVAMLRKRGITKSMVYQHYAKLCPDGFKHSAFGERLNAYLGMTKPSMRVPHKVGDFGVQPVDLCDGGGITEERGFYARL
jgi:transposase